MTFGPAAYPAAKAKGKGARAAASELLIGVGPLGDAELLPAEIDERIAELRAQMVELAKSLRYEEAARARDRIRVLEARRLEFVHA